VKKMAVKLCPMRKDVCTVSDYEKQEHFLECLGKSCAWYDHDDCVIRNIPYVMRDLVSL
jgi:hypothetical protein